MSSERELVARAARGDETAVITLYEQNKTAVFSYIYYRVGSDQALAEEITAEVFTRMVARLPHFVYRERPLLAWLYTVARNCITDYYRHNNHFTQQPLSEQYPDQMTSPEQQSHLNLEKRCLLQAMAQLTESQRDVVILRFVEERSVAETAVLLHKKEGAVKTLTRRALAALRRQLDLKPEHE